MTLPPEFHDAYIVIHGLGGVVNGPAGIVVDALRKAGFTVDVRNAHADSPCRPVEEWETKGPITVEVNHLPWGG